MITKNPYLSIVVTSRNDNHDITLLKRMRIFYTSLIYQLEKYKLSSELIIVEWNPPTHKPRLIKVLPKIKSNKFAQVKIISVPQSIHKQFPNSKTLGLYQFIAKNVGIRRAKGEFILASNIDILFSNDVIEYLSQENLEINTLLRSIRFDIPKSISEKWSISQRLQYCKKNYYNAYKQKNSPKVVSFLNRIFKKIAPEEVFTNACGDFTLLSKEKWHKLRGYPEFPMHGVKIDGLLVYQAIFSGADQVILPENACIYHIDHKNSWSSNKSLSLQNRLREKGIPFIASEEYRKYIELMRSKKGKYLFNDHTWGLVNVRLPEKTSS